MRVSIGLAATVFAVCATAQQVPFIAVTGPNAPKGASFLLLDNIRGGIWMGGMVEGSEGLTYFDGSRFFSPLKTAFPNVVISGMAEDSEGGVWLATSGGIYRAFQGSLLRAAEGSAESGIAAATKDVFVAAVTKAKSKKIDLLRVSRAADGGWKTDIVMPLTNHSAFQADHAGNVLYVCDGGYCEFRAIDAANWLPGAQLPIIAHADVAIPRNLWPHSVLRDRFGCIWFRDNPEAAVHCPGSEAGLNEDIKGSGYHSIKELNDGTIILPFFDKLAIGRPGQLHIIPMARGYPGAMNAVATNDGSIWLSNGNGAFVLPSLMPMEFWTEKEGLAGNTWSIVRSSNHTLAVAGESLMRLNEDRGRWSLVRNSVAVSHITAGVNGAILQTLGRGQQFSLTGNGKVIGKEHRELSAKHGQSQMCWDALASAGWDEELGLAQKQCIGVFRNGQTDVWYGINEREGGFSLLERPGGQSRALHNFVSGSEVGNATVRFFGIDNRGWIWRGSPIGIYVAEPEMARQGQWLHLNRLDGIAGTDANRGSFFSDPDGSVWFGLDASINHLYPPSDLLHPAAAPAIFLSGYSVNNGATQMTELASRIQSGDSVTALIGSLLYARRNALRLRYRLLPEQTQWQQTANLDIALGSLSAGTHTLEVQGRIFIGPWSPSVKQSFVVLPPAWLAAPFLWTYALAALAIVAAIEWRRRKRISDERSMLPDLAEWRMDVLEPEGHPLCGSTLDGRYQIGSLLARGGFASVLAAYDEHNRRPCAVKVFRGEVKNKLSIRQGFEQEIAALRKVRHPNVVSIYADGITANGAPYLVMEFIEGPSLRNILDEGPLPPDRAGKLLRQLAEALDAIHAHGIFHRDVKPENVIVRNSDSIEQAILIDFSIAIIKDVNETLHGISRAAGTFDYMAPEQALGYAQPSSDIFSLAKVVMEMLGGVRLSQRLPNAALDLPARVLDILNESEFRLSNESKRMLANALEFDPSKRPHKASEFAYPVVQDLTQAAAHSPK